LVLALALVGYLQRGAPKPERDTRNRFEVIATAYTSRPTETSGDPYLAAWNNRLTPGERSIAVSRDLLALGLTNGAEVEIEGHPVATPCATR
jgi:hypothetical protein